MTTDTHANPKIAAGDSVSNVAAPWVFQFEVWRPSDEAYRKMLESITQVMIRGFSVGFDTRNVRELPPDKIAVEPETFTRVLR